jgi:carbon monoxide dehydrogenase subunit G
MQARSSTRVEASPEDVFAFIADPANDRRWRSHLASSRGSVSGVGDRVTQTYSAQVGSKTVELEVTEYSPPERLAYRMSGGPVRARLAFQCRPEDGGTRVSMSLSADIGGIASIAEGRVEAEVLKLARADLAKLKQVLESVG